MQKQNTKNWRIQKHVDCVELFDCLVPLVLLVKRSKSPISEQQTPDTRSLELSTESFHTETFLQIQRDKTDFSFRPPRNTGQSTPDIRSRPQTGNTAPIMPSREPERRTNRQRRGGDHFLGDLVWFRACCCIVLERSSRLPHSVAPRGVRSSCRSSFGPSFHSEFHSEFHSSAHWSIHAPVHSHFQSS